METALRINSDIHSELKAICQEKNIPMSTGAGALLRFALDAHNNGEIELAPVTVRASTPQPQPEEVASA